VSSAVEAELKLLEKNMRADPQVRVEVEDLAEKMYVAAWMETGSSPPLALDSAMRFVATREIFRRNVRGAKS
jgi:hypothetical protein